MTTYSFTTVWYVDAPIDRVWNVIQDSKNWPSWWKHVKKVEELAPGDANGIGSMQHHEWSTALPYRLVFDIRTTKVEPPHTLEAESKGELEGTGRWSLSQEGPVTVVRYDWNVRTTKAWMNLLAPLARPLFAWNHRVVMEEGGESLARLLGARLVKPSVHTINVSA